MKNLSVGPSGDSIFSTCEDTLLVGADFSGFNWTLLFLTNRGTARRVGGLADDSWVQVQAGAQIKAELEE